MVISVPHLRLARLYRTDATRCQRLCAGTRRIRFPVALDAATTRAELKPVRRQAVWLGLGTLKEGMTLPVGMEVDDAAQRLGKSCTMVSWVISGQIESAWI